MGRIDSRARRVLEGRERERGQVSLLILGFTVVAILLVIGGIDVTAVQLARVRTLDAADAADAAAVDASDALDLGDAYTGGLRESVRVSEASVVAAASGYLAAQPLPHGLTEWHLAAGTGSPDGRTSVVRLQATVQLPMLGSVLTSLGSSASRIVTLVHWWWLVTGAGAGSRGLSGCGWRSG